jgi:hypothetical protein
MDWLYPRTMPLTLYLGVKPFLPAGCRTHKNFTCTDLTTILFAATMIAKLERTEAAFLPTSAACNGQAWSLPTKYKKGFEDNRHELE